MSLAALATAEPVGAVSANDEAVADMGDHSAHVSAFLRHEHVNKLAALRDEFVRIATDGRFVDAASREWRGIPMVWREALLLLAGAGVDTEESLEDLAKRGWQEMPPPEREAVRGIVRGAKRHLGRLTALAARV